MHVDVTIIARAELGDYPGHGKPCNRCGVCCKITLCVVARAAFGHPLNATVPGPCPALETTEPAKHQCGLMVHPARYAPARAARYTEPTLAAATRFILGAGDGCDMPVVGQPIDKDHMRRCAAEALRLRGAADAAGRVWGIERG